MSKPVISVENLSKAYRIGAKEEVPDTLVGAMKGIFSSPLKNFRRLRNLDTSSWHSAKKRDSDSETLWALKDVSFEVNEGEVIGIIGRNGAGKSTLLKVLSRITEPTSGRVVIRGRVSSLLEVGTGFHPELSGRENVYMNGTILGMTKKEIDSKFDEIVDFSGVEKFLDTPTKRYSSGMKVRLAFAVAAHLEPEILVIDEVLAVGDAEFQGKCLGKMRDVAEGGRTVLFVSHNMPAVRSLCSRGVVLTAGTVTHQVSAEEAITEYLSALQKPVNSSLNGIHRTGAGNVRVIGVSVESQNGGSELTTGDPTSVCVTWSPAAEDVECVITFYDEYGVALATFDSHNKLTTDFFSPISQGVNFEIPQLPLIAGCYRMNIALVRNGEREDHIEGATQFTVAPGRFLGRPGAANNRYGAFTFPHRWVMQTDCPE